jgi:hypothetical protein
MSATCIWVKWLTTKFADPGTYSQMSVDQMSVNQLSMDQMSLDQMSVDQMIVEPNDC